MKKPAFLRKGFTLIELLVVISIISLLSSVVLASLKNARSRSKDSKKIQELIQLRTALELYRSVNNTYPLPDNNGGGQVVSGNCNMEPYWAEETYYESNNWIAGLVPKYYSKLPGSDVAPYVPYTVSQSNQCYVYYSDGTDYKLTLVGGLETMCQTVVADSLCGNHIVSSSGMVYSASIYSPGAKDFTVEFNME